MNNSLYSYKQYSRQVMTVYNSLDKQIKKFVKVSKLKCIPKCGQCCETAKVEASVLEFLPLAFRLWQKKKAEYWLEKLSAMNDLEGTLKSVCVFYQAHPVIPGQGRCSVYPWRGLLCRLFNFSARYNKNRELELIICQLLRNSNPELINKIERMAAEGLSVPVMRDYSFQIYNIYPYLGDKQYPVNEAVKTALEIIGFILQTR